MNPLLMLMAIFPDKFSKISFQGFEIPNWAIILIIILGMVVMFMFFMLVYGFIYFNFIWESGAEVPKLLTL